jgi:hypothetical protein
MPAASPARRLPARHQLRPERQILGGYFNTPRLTPDNVVESSDERVVQLKASSSRRQVRHAARHEVIDIVANKQVTQGVLFTYAIRCTHRPARLRQAGETSAGRRVTNGWNNATT